MCRKAACLEANEDRKVSREWSEESQQDRVLQAENAEDAPENAAQRKGECRRHD